MTGSEHRSLELSPLTLQLLGLLTLNHDKGGDSWRSKQSNQISLKKCRVEGCMCLQLYTLECLIHVQMCEMLNVLAVMKYTLLFEK